MTGCPRGPGSRMINAKLMIRENVKAPYLTTTVWKEPEDSRLTEEMTNMVFRDVESEVLEKFINICAGS